jgi:hypothetical protein
VSRSVRTRLEREADQRREAKKCPPHPPEKAFWASGDWATSDRLICGRCYVTLAQRPHHARVVVQS